MDTFQPKIRSAEFRELEPSGFFIVSASTKMTPVLFSTSNSEFKASVSCSSDKVTVEVALTDSASGEMSVDLGDLKVKR